MHVFVVVVVVMPYHYIDNHAQRGGNGARDVQNNGVVPGERVRTGHHPNDFIYFFLCAENMYVSVA